MKKLLSIVLLITALLLGSCKEEPEVNRVEKGATKSVKGLSYTFSTNAGENTVKSGNHPDSTQVLSPIERKVLSIDTLEIGGETFIASLIEENDLIETKATNPQVVESASVYTFYAYKGSVIKSQTIGTSNTTLFVPQDEATKYGIIFLSSAEGMEKPKQLTPTSIDGSSKIITYKAKFNENVCYKSFDKVTMPPGSPIDITFEPVFSQLGIYVPSKVGERIITVKEVKLESGVQETANVVVTYNSEEVSNIKVDYAKVATTDYTPILECVPNAANDATILKGDYYNIIPNGKDAKVKITMLLSGTPETTKSHTIDFKKVLEGGKRYTISLTNKVPILIELEDPLNIEPGQKGTLTAKVKMSDGTTETIATPTTGFTWTINSPKGVVISKDGGVVVLGSDKNIVTGSSTTNVISLTAEPDYYGSTTVTVTYGGLSTTAQVNVYRDIPETKYYMWDAPVGAYYNSTYPTNNYNTITSGVASRSCANAPTLEQLNRYLGAGVYWVTDGPPFKLPNSTTIIHRKGLLLMKDANIPVGTVPTDFVTLKTGFSSDPNINDKSDYFFLPACGFYHSGSFFPYNIGDIGDYWLSTPDAANGGSFAYNLYFTGSFAELSISTRDRGYVPLVGFDPTYEPATVESIIISPDPLDIETGQSGVLTATVKMSDGSTLTPTSDFKWEIIDTRLVTGSSTSNTITLTAAGVSSSTTVKVTYKGVSAIATVNVILPSTFTAANYYMWDAPIDEPYSTTNNGANVNYNITTSSTADQSCANTPTHYQIQMYLAAGLFWVTDGPAYKLPDGKTYRTGLMVKKSAKIAGFKEGTAEKVEFTGPTTGVPYKSLKDDYFFLPACGDYSYGRFNSAGTYGRYWLSLPSTSSSLTAVCLYFSSSSVDVGYGHRDFGYVPMPLL